MICTLLAVILVVFFNLFPGTTTPQPTFLTTLFICTGTLLIFLFVAINGLVLITLQRAESKNLPRIVEMFRKDRRIQLINGYLLGFSLLNYLHVYDPKILHLTPIFLFSLWIVLMGIALDLIHYFFRRAFDYLNPFGAIRRLTEQAKKSIVSEKDDELCQWIDVLTEVGNRAIDRNGISLCNEVVDEEQKITRFFLESCKSISRLTPPTEEDKKTKDIDEAMGKDADEVSFMLYYISQRLEYLFDNALKRNLKPVCHTVISALGKIMLYAANFDLSLVSTPVHLIGNLAHKAQENGNQEIADLAAFTLLEVAKAILNETNIAYSDLKDPYLSILANLDEIAKTTFKRDKSTSTPILSQPIRQLKALFNTEKMANHQDTETILNAINRVIGEWDALDQVLKSMPPINKITEGLIAES